MQKWMVDPDGPGLWPRGDLKTDESDDCGLGDCADCSGSPVIRGSSLLTALAEPRGLIGPLHWNAK